MTKAIILEEFGGSEDIQMIYIQAFSPTYNENY